MKLFFEEVPNDQNATIMRARVPGGWLVREIVDADTVMPDMMGSQSGYQWRVALTFIPDPDHRWIE